MEDYKSNSYKSREEAQKKPQEKKLEKVISGNAKAKKKTETRKFAEAFIKEDLGNIGSYIVSDVLVPAIKRTIMDSVRALLGDTTSSSRPTTASKVSYRNFYDERDGRTQYNAIPQRSGFDYDDILFATRGDAEAVLDALDAALSQYGVVSVGDLYDLSDVSTDNYTVMNYGWTDLRSTKVVAVRDGYVLKLPRALPLK